MTVSVTKSLLQAKMCFERYQKKEIIYSRKYPQMIRKRPILCLSQKEMETIRNQLNVGKNLLLSPCVTLSRNNEIRGGWMKAEGGGVQRAGEREQQQRRLNETSMGSWEMAFGNKTGAGGLIRLCWRDKEVGRRGFKGLEWGSRTFYFQGHI